MVSKRQKEDWKVIRNMTWREDDEFLDEIKEVLDDGDPDREPIRRSAERPRGRTDERR